MTFSQDLDNFDKKFSRESAGKILGIVFELDRRLVEKSPVGNPTLWKNPGAAPPGYVGGTFSANWQYGFNHIPSGTLDTTDSAASQAKVMGDADIANYRGIHYLVNNMVYSERLEDGHSTQAKEGVLHVTAMEFEDVVRGIV